MGNNNASCAVRKALLSIEQSSRHRAKCSAEISTQVVYGAISLEIQKQRFAHECKCSLCVRPEAA